MILETATTEIMRAATTESQPMTPEITEVAKNNHTVTSATETSSVISTSRNLDSNALPIGQLY